MSGNQKGPSNRRSAEIDRIVGQNMQRVREEARLGQQEVATLLGVSVQSLASYEEGQERPPALVLLEFSQTVTCLLTDLFYGMPSMEEDYFPGSRPSRSPLLQQKAERAVPTSDPTHSMTSSLPDPQTDLNNNALAVAEILRAFGNLTDPVRHRLLSLLQVIYGTPGLDL